jgi:hypothetical protein
MRYQRILNDQRKTNLLAEVVKTILASLCVLNRYSKIIKKCQELILIWDPNLGPQFGTPIWDPNLGPQFGTPIWDPNLGPQFGTPIWDP